MFADRTSCQTKGQPERGRGFSDEMFISERGLTAQLMVEVGHRKVPGMPGSEGVQHAEENH